MKQLRKISVEQCCTYYKIETTFVQQLDQHGLIQLIRSGKGTYIDFEQLADLEKYTHMHYDLNINFEGIEAIKHLLNRVQGLQRKLMKLQGELQRP